MSFIRAVVFVILLAAIGAAACIYFGVYDVAADVPHSAVVQVLLQTARERSIDVRAREIRVPPLNDPKMVAEGAEHYSEMCTGCHLAPGMADSEIRRGLYPKPPNLSQYPVLSPARMFWSIKHGIKLTAMPAWGTTHDDQAIWDIVSFLQKLPGMTPEEYRAATAKAAHDDDAPHHHHDEAGDAPASGDAPGAMTMDAPAGASADSSAAAEDGTAPTVDTAVAMNDLKHGDAPDAETVARQFHDALQNGNRSAVLDLLAPDATISEGGHTQTRAEYASGHLAEDIDFLKSAQTRVIDVRSLSFGDTAVVGTESEIRTGADGRQKALRSHEMLALARRDGGWKISAIHWQSAPAVPN